MTVHLAPLIAGAAAAVAVVVHGGVGHRWMTRQLDAVELPASTLFGDAQVGRRVFVVTWHAVTAMFVVSAATLFAMAFGAVDLDVALLRFIAALHAAVLVVGAVVLVTRLDALRGRIPPVFVTCMTTVAVASWLASRSVG
jgi:hypothetical protein